jgi:hypothetical protein
MNKKLFPKPAVKFLFGLGTISAGILEQSVEARNKVGIGCCRATKAGGIDSLESVSGLQKSFKIPTL